MTRLFLYCISVIAFSFALAAMDRVAAQAIGSGPEGISDARILEGWQEKDGAIVAAIRVDLAPGWHTYWRVPGEFGIPPQFDWSRSENLAALSYEWPRPQIYEEAGMHYFGYEGSLTLPVRLVPKTPNEPIVARVDLSLGVCKEICMPGTAAIATTLATEADPWEVQEIRAALRQRALTPEEAGISLVRCSLSPASDGIELTAELAFDRAPAPGQLALIESRDPSLWIGKPRTRMEGNRLVTTAKVSGGSGANVMIDRKNIRLTLLDEARAVDFPGCGATS